MSMNLVVPFGLVEFYFTEDFSSFRKFTVVPLVILDFRFLHLYGLPSEVCLNQQV